jgi:hypothetical protein
MRIFLSFWVLQGIVLGYVSAQDASNPFELVMRLPEEARLTLADTSENALANPFDVVVHKVPGAAKALAENETAPFTPFSVVPRGGGMPQSVLIWVLLLVSGFLAFSVAANRSAANKAWMSFLSENGLNVIQREAFGMVGNTPYYLLYGSFVLNAGLFIFLVVRAFRGEDFNNLPFLLLCMAGAAIAFLTKHAMLNATGWLFPVTKETERYNFLMIVFNCVLGLFLMPFNYVLAFCDENFRFFLVFWILGLVGIFYIYRGFRAAGIGAKFLGTDQFHFLLYLCAVEIAPVLLVIKWATVQGQF